MVLRGVALEGWNGPVRELSLTAERASIDLGARVASLDQVRIALSGPESRGLEVRAPRGEFDLQHGALWLRGGVEGQTQPGERFTTEALRFDQQAGRLRSDQPVRIERPNLDLSARGMDIDLGERRLLLRGAVQAELKAQ